MINQLKDAIATKLFANYPNYSNYTNMVPQGFKEPCFFISSLEPNEERVLSKRYFKKCPFVIQCFPSGDSKSDTLEYIAETLYSELEFITVQDRLLMGSKAKYQIIDEVLHFFINYNFHVYRVPINPEETDFMETLSLDIKVVD